MFFSARFRGFGLSIALVILSLAHSACAVEIFWASEPVRAGETVYLQGDQLDAGSKVEVVRLNDDEMSPVSQMEVIETDLYNRMQRKTVKAEQAVGSSLKFLLPEGKDNGIYACRVVNGKQKSDVFLINSPKPWWIQGDDGEAASSPGGWLRIFGRCIDFDGGGQAVLRPVISKDKKGQAKQIELKKIKADNWSLHLEIPSELANGEYEVFVHNGLGGAYGWKKAGIIKISEKNVWKKDVFNINDYKDDSRDYTNAVLNAVKAAGDNGGGIVYFPPGRYEITKMIEMPSFVVLKGASRDLVTLSWPDVKNPPPALIRGLTSFGIEDISIQAGKHCDGIQVTACHNALIDGRGDVHIRRINMRLDPLSPVTRRNLWGKEGSWETYASRLQTDRYAAVRLGGRNVELSDSFIFTRGAMMDIVGIYLERVNGAVIANNECRSSYRIGLYVQGSENIIVENTDLTGGFFVGTHHTKKTLNNYCYNMYFANNLQRFALMHDSEMVSTDSHKPAGAYFGKVDNVDGKKMLLSSDPLYPKFWSRWDGYFQSSDKGAGIYILDGKGAGQYRRVTGGDGRNVEMDEPWQLDPDKNSLISIGKLHGRFLFVDNTFKDGGAFQLWAGSLECVVSGNKYYRIGSIASWSGDIYGGIMPDWYSQFLDNEAFQAGSFKIGSYPYKEGGIVGGEVYKGPIARGGIMRRNVNHTSNVVIEGGVDGAVMENCRARGFSIDRPRGIVKPVNVLTRGNIEENIDK